MRKFNFLFLGLLAGLLLFAGGLVRGQSFLGTKTPYVTPSVGYTPVPSGFKPAFVNYVGRHGARFMTKAGPDVSALALLEAASRDGGLTELGKRAFRMVGELAAVEKGQYENITLLGAEEQEGIGRRMFAAYGSAFSGRGLDVVVTYKVRTQQSADAFLKGLAGYKGPRQFSKLPDSLDAVLRFYDLSVAYQKYKKGPVLKAAFDSLERDHRNEQAAAAVCERVFTAGYRSSLSGASELKFFNDLYDLYSLQFSVVRETKNSVDLGGAFGREDLAWEDFVSGAQDFLEKGPGRDPLGIQVKVAAPLLVDFIKTTDRVVSGGGGPDAVLRFTHAEAISPFATLLGIPEASQPVADIFSYAKYWQAERIIPLSANVEWVVYSDGRDWLVKVLLNEREVRFGDLLGKGPYCRWEILRRYCVDRLRAVGADLKGNMNNYLKELR